MKVMVFHTGLDGQGGHEGRDIKLAELDLDHIPLVGEELMFDDYVLRVADRVFFPKGSPLTGEREPFIQLTCIRSS